MIFLILSIGLVFGVGCYNFISNIYYNVLIMIYMSNNTYNFVNNDFYYINEIYRSNYIVYYDDCDKELKSYYCQIAYTSLEDSKLHLYCYNYNINNNEKEGKMKIFYNINKENVELLITYNSLQNLKLLKNKLPDDILKYIGIFISNIKSNDII